MRNKANMLIRIGVASILALPIFALAGTTGAGNPIEASQVESQPNLMILLSNSASMSENLSSSGYATGPSGEPVQKQCATNYPAGSSYLSVPDMDDGYTGACNGVGTYFRYGTYGNLPTSKFYVAKQTLYDLLKNGDANGINLGFATYRQAMGMQLSTVQTASNAIYPYIYLPQQTPGKPSSDIGSESYTTLSNIATNPLNFGFVDWWPVYNAYAPNGTGDGFHGNTDAFLGNGMNNTFQSAPLFGPVSYLSGKNGDGLPSAVQLPAGTLQNSSVSSGPYQYSYYGPGGLTAAQKSVGVAEPDLKLCQTYYNSQENAFQAIYAANQPDGQPDYFQQSFPNAYNGNQLFYDTLNYPQFVDGKISTNDYEQACNAPDDPAQVLVGNAYVQQTDQFSNGHPAYFDYIPNVNSGIANNGGSLSLNPGAATGWSGATQVSASGNVTARYPSTPQPESILGSYDQSGAKWMGPFVNLPSPADPVNNAPVIERLINPAFPMENPSGTEYSYSQQNMLTSNGQNRSIVNSTEAASYNGHQEPLYNALVDAYAYWSAFEKSDTTAQCQDNNMLVIFDGVSDGDPNMTATQEKNALIQEAKALYNQLHVKLFVIVIATNSGAIREADALAHAGGTGTAYTVSSSGQLYNDLSQTFINIAHEQIHAALSTTPIVSNGSEEFAVVNVSQDTGEGDLVAYGITSNGVLTNATSLTPIWDANSLMNTQNRTDNIQTTLENDPLGSFYGTGDETTLSHLANQNPGDFQLSPDSGLTAAEVAAYTINPSYDSGKYLGGRQNGWWIGLPAENAPTIISPPDNGSDLADSGYTQFAGDHAYRENTVVFAANDGLLYAIGFHESTTKPAPQFLWAWMPNGLIPALQGYNTFWQTDDQNGGFTEIDSSNSQGVWHSYLVGAAESGDIFYDLQLAGTQSPELSHTVAEYDLSGAGLSGTLPIDTPPATWTDSAGVAQAAWTANITNNSASTTTPAVLLLNVSNGAYLEVTLPVTPTSMPIFSASGALYFAAGQNLYEIDASNMATLIGEEQTGNVQGTLNSTNGDDLIKDLGNIAPYPSEVSKRIDRLQLAYSGGNDYLIAESAQGLSVLLENESGWTLQWLTTTDGAEVLHGTTLVAAPTTGADAILPLPAQSTISDTPLIANNAIILPVAVRPNANTCGLSNAEYILYNIKNGSFPNDGFVSSNNGAAESQVLDIGYGTAYTPSLSVFDGKALIQSSASNTNASKVFAASISNGLPVGGAVQSRFVW